MKLARRFVQLLEEELPNVVHLQDPAGNSFTILVVEKDGGLFFFNGLRRLWDFYHLHRRVTFSYVYKGHGHFTFKIWNIKEKCEIGYPEVVNETQQHTTNNNPHQILVVESELMWKHKISKAQERRKQGLIVPVTIVKHFLEIKQLNTDIHLPNKTVQPWGLLWNKKYVYHCKMGKWWYQFCRKHKLKEGDEVHIWKIEDEDAFRLVLNVLRD
ncbi:DNA-binding barrel domain superfamily [Sesbania bispinosa]|nr:DNA-binding barrel domain superfamily [Sesbania bispinosa]